MCVYGPSSCYAIVAAPPPLEPVRPRRKRMAGGESGEVNVPSKSLPFRIIRGPLLQFNTIILLTEVLLQVPAVEFETKNLK